MWFLYIHIYTFVIYPLLYNIIWYVIVSYIGDPFGSASEFWIWFSIEPSWICLQKVFSFGCSDCKFHSSMQGPIFFYLLYTSLPLHIFHLPHWHSPLTCSVFFHNPSIFAPCIKNFLLLAHALIMRVRTF